MTDKELIARLRADSGDWLTDAAADRIEQLVKEAVLNKAAYEGVSSLLLSVQQDCIKERQRAERLEAALRPFADYMTEGMDKDHSGAPLPDTEGVGWVYLTHGDFRRARAERLEAALHNCVGMLDQLVAESGRAIEWGAEDPFRMGEWFEPEDLAQIEQARAALAGDSHD